MNCLSSLPNKRLFLSLDGKQYRQDGNYISLYFLETKNLICRLCAGSDKRKKESMRWAEDAVALGAPVVLMSQYTLLVGARSIAEDGEKAYPW